MKKKIIISLLVFATLVLVTVAIYIIVLLYNRANVAPRDTTSKKTQGPIVPIEISKVIVTFPKGGTEAEICWETSAPGKSNVEYGLESENMLTLSTKLTTEYLSKHCITLPNLVANKSYLYKLYSVSEQGLADKYVGKFSSESLNNSYSGTLNECINLKPIAINAEKNLIAEFSTSYPSICEANYGINSKQYDQIGKPLETSKALIHSFDFDTSTITDDLYYSIVCSVDFPSGSKSCSVNEILPFCKFGNCN